MFVFLNFHVSRISWSVLIDTNVMNKLIFELQVAFRFQKPVLLYIFVP